MLKPKPIIERAVRIHAISVRSPAISERRRARSVRSSARTVPLSFVTGSTLLMESFLTLALYRNVEIRLSGLERNGNTIERSKVLLRKVFRLACPSWWQVGRTAQSTESVHEQRPPGK